MPLIGPNYVTAKAPNSPRRNQRATGAKADSRAPRGQTDSSGRADRTGTLRIIGGKWRGRRLAIADVPGLRPTPDRVRETLFNWLMAPIRGARCVDLFAGTGALGFEALSRGAAHVTFVERHRAPRVQLAQSLELLECTDAQIARGDALSFLGDCLHMAALPESQLSGSASAIAPSVAPGLSSDAFVPFDVVFIDPPFAEDLQAPTLELLTTPGLLSDGALVYVELATPLEDDALPAGYELLRAKSAGKVRYHLLEFASADLT